MPAKNIHHDAVVDALKADGWTVTDDPLTLQIGDRDLHIDLGAEILPLGAERDGVRIAVEIQSFRTPSNVADLQQAIGQFAMYRLILAEQEPDRVLYLAVPTEVYHGILSEPLGMRIVAGLSVRLVLFDPDRREALKWIN
jgi:hypothetical protein